MSEELRGGLGKFWGEIRGVPRRYEEVCGCLSRSEEVRVGGPKRSEEI